MANPVVPERIGIVKAWDFEGTRVQVEFAFLNDTDHLVAIRDVVLRIGRVWNLTAPPARHKAIFRTSRAR
jgi:hypothetical protein